MAQWGQMQAAHAVGGSPSSLGKGQEGESGPSTKTPQKSGFPEAPWSLDPVIGLSSFIPFFYEENVGEVSPRPI